MGCHYILLLPIYINKQDLSGIQITQSIILLSIQHFYPNRHSSKVRHRKRKLSNILRIPLFSPSQRWYYSFIVSTKITCKTYQLHKYCQWIWPYCCFCILHESSTWWNLTQIKRPCDFISPRRRRITPIVPPYLFKQEGKVICWMMKQDKKNLQGKYVTELSKLK